MSYRLLRLTEHYASIQGEGPRTGAPTQFVRFAGCNYRCPGWPCDTPYSIFPDQYLHNSFTYDNQQFSKAVHDLDVQTGATNIAFTGGEPFLQDATRFLECADWALGEGYTLEVFTNGSFVFPQWALRDAQINWDYKLPGSGEWRKNPEEYEVNLGAVKMTDMIKFVIKDPNDFEVAVDLIQQWQYYGATVAQIWMGVAWNVNYTVAQLVKDLQSHPEIQPVHVNVQVHKYIWRDKVKGV